MWNERYSASDYVYGTEPNDFLKQMCSHFPEKGQVLCIADGEGRNSVYVAKQGMTVSAMDGSEVGMAKARKLAESHGVALRTEVADLGDYEITPNSWDGIVSIFAHLPPQIRKRIHRQVVAGLKKGGVLILEAYHPRQLEFKTGGPPVAEMMMTANGLKEELEGLQFIHCEELERDVVEGKFHTGKAAVVQVVAVKN